MYWHGHTTVVACLSIAFVTIGLSPNVMPHCMLNYTVSHKKNITDVINFNLKKDDPLFIIIFGTNIDDTTGHQMTVQLPPHLTSASALPGKSRTSEMCVEMSRNVPDITNCNLKNDY